MLGRAVLDPDQVESSQAHVPGLGLLDCSTVFNRDKETARVAGVHLDSGTAVQGYEIHMGCTQGADDARPLFRIDERHGMQAEGYDGLASPDGRVWGTYLHGLFDNEAFRHWWLARLRPEAAAADLAWNSAHENRFDTLAAAVRNSIDVAQLYRVMGL
jgi:adenosylcobyric acid synthase